MTEKSTVHPKNEFYMYVGYCVTAWAKVEEELFGCLANILGGPLERAAIIYYRNQTISMRLALVDELMLTALPKRERKSGGHDHAEVKEWAALKARIEVELSTRNQIAHHPVSHAVALRHRKTGEVIPIPVGKALALNDYEFYNSYWIYMSKSELLRGKKTPEKSLKTDDLSIHSVQVQKIADDLKTFRTQKLRPRLQAVAQQEAKRQLAQDRPAVRLTIGRRPRPK